MQIARGSVRNFRSIPVSGARFPFGRFTCVVGPNDSGKTSLLLGTIGALWILTKNVTARNRGGHWGAIYNLENRFDPKQEGDLLDCPMEVQLEVIPSPAEWEAIVAGTRAKQGTPNGIEELPLIFTVDLRQVLRDDQNVDTNLFGAGQRLDIAQTLKRWPDNLGARKQMQTLLKEIGREDNQASWDWLSSYTVIWIDANRSAHFGNYSLNSGRDEAKNLARYYIEQEPGEIIKLVDALTLPARQREFRRFMEYIKIVIPDVDDVRLRPDSLGRNVYVKRRGREQPLYRSGSGITNVLYLCGRILEAAQEINAHGALVIIDEPETGLHADFHRRLMRLAAAIHDAYGVQWLLSTHSPYLLIDSLTTNDRLVLTQIHDDSTSVAEVPVDEDTGVIMEAVGFYLPSILNAKGVLFVEGPSELAFLHTALPKVGLDPDKYGLVIVPLGGDQLLSYIDPDMLARIHPHSFVWLDSELRAENSPLDPYRKKFFDGASKSMTVFIDLSVRSLENIYPNEVVRTICSCAHLPTYGAYDDVWESLQCSGCTYIMKNKPKFARAVAQAMTPEQVDQLRIVSEIRRWMAQHAGANPGHERLIP